jgi:hypothetical protein
MYNFGILGFQSFNVKFWIKLKIFKSQNWILTQFQKVDIIGWWPNYEGCRSSKVLLFFFLQIFMLYSKIRSNFEFTETLLLSPFEFKSKFQKLCKIGVWSQKKSCRVQNFEQLLFLEIFVFQCKIRSNFEISKVRAVLSLQNVSKSLNNSC